MRTSTQLLGIQQEMTMQNSYPYGLQEKKSGLGYRNGLSVVLKKIHKRAKTAMGTTQARCPDGEVHHPSVCLRGWRGDVCQLCQHCGL